MSASVRNLFISVITCACTVGLDQYTKERFFEMHPLKIYHLLGGWLEVGIDHRNYGIAFNLSISRWLILSITFVACAAILWFIVRARTRSSPWPSFFLGLLLGGALGNAIDRVQLWFVRDWILLWFRSAINLADLAVLAGLAGVASSARTRVIP